MKNLRLNNSDWPDHFLRAAAQAGLLLFAATLLNHPARAADDPAVAAARKRQTDIHTFDIEFKRTEVIPKGWFAKSLKGVLPGPRPPQDTTLESTNRIVVDHEKFRFESNHPVGGVMQFVPYHLISIDDGKTLTEYFPNGLTEKIPFAGLKKTGSFEPLPPLSELPIWWSLRALDSKFMPYLASDATRTGATRPVDGVDCLEVKLPDGRRTLSLCLDPSQNFEPRLIEQWNESELTCKWEIKNRNYNRYGWLPDSWVCTVYQGSDLRKITTTNVTWMRLNQVISDDLFAVHFAEGTHVADTRNRQDFVANADGTLREISLQEERFREEHPPRPPSWLARNRWWSFGIAMALIVVLMFVRFRRRPKSTSLN